MHKQQEKVKWRKNQKVMKIYEYAGRGNCCKLLNGDDHSKGIDSVTVKDICECAMVNRATFYRHYLDKYDLLDQYMDELYDLLDQPQVEQSFDGPDSPPLGLIYMLEHLRGHTDFYAPLLGPKGYPVFAERTRFYIEKRFGAPCPQAHLCPIPAIHRLR